MIQLKEQLLSIRTRASVDVRFQRAEANAKTASTLRSFRQTETTIEQEIGRYKEELKTEEIVHNETADFLRKKQRSLASTFDEWEKKYDKDLDVLSGQYNKMVTARESNLEVLMGLKARREKEVATELARCEAEEAEKEAEEIRKKLEEKMNNAAGLIQVIARMFMKRVKEKEKAGGGKKGGKKGKGKKK